MALFCRIISLENAAEFPIFCRTLSEALTRKYSKSCHNCGKKEKKMKENQYCISCGEKAKILFVLKVQSKAGKGNTGVFTQHRRV